jgi:hypothetical protein
VSKETPVKRIALMLAAAAGIAISATLPARAEIANLKINNNTNRSVWITEYAETNVPWSIMRAFCLKAHQSASFGGGRTAHMKLRAEVKLRTDCAGPTISDTYDTRTSMNSSAESLVANVVERGNDESFYIKIVGN